MTGKISWTGFISVFKPVRWYQNLLIPVGAFSAALLLHRDLKEWPVVLLVTIAGCLIASGNYGINEVFDMEQDRYHPKKKDRALPSGSLDPGRTLLLSAVIYAVGFGIILLLKQWLVAALFIFYLINALAYNLKPFRLKDRAFLDFISEALNNPARFLAGWYAIPGAHAVFPVGIVSAIWFFGIFLTASKRFGEVRFIRDRGQLEHFRKSMIHYSERKLLSFMIASMIVSYCLFGAFFMTLRIDLLALLPFVLVWTIWFFYLAYEENTIVKDPERVFEKIPFMLFSILSISLLIGMVISKTL